MTRPSTDHVRCHACELTCAHCGLRHAIANVPLAYFSDEARGFALMHKHCPPRPTVSKQVELFDALAAKEVPQAMCGECGCIHRPGENTLCPGWRPGPFIPDPVAPPIRASDWLQELANDDAEVGECGLCSKVGPRQFYETGLMMVCLGGCAGIDGMSDDPDPETDPPGYVLPDEDPVTSLSGPVLDTQALLHLIKCVRPKEFWPTLKEMADWHQDVRTRVQDWCRIEHAHAHPIKGITLPERTPLPNVLAALEFPHPKKPKKGARPLTSGKRRGKGVEA